MDIKQQLEAVYCSKSLQDLEKSDPYLINRMLSFNSFLFNQVAEINKYVFSCDKKILNGLFLSQVPRFNSIPWVGYIKKTEEQQQEYDFIIQAITKYYGWSRREVQIHLPILLKLFQNKESLHELFRFFGVERKYYEQFGVGFNSKKRGLEAWS